MEGSRMAVILAIVLTCVFSGTCNPHSSTFDSSFARFLQDNGYTGGAVTALKDGRVVLAKGFGHTKDGSRVKAGSSFPVSGLSRSLTAVAVVKLLQQGLLSLDDKVFGKTGILHMIHPTHPNRADPRLYDITVGHLLRHSAGWDSTQGPLFDPLLNAVYQHRGHDVPDMAEAMRMRAPLDAYSVIRYVISRPLHYTPGTRVIDSNVGYLLLGRVVEETSALIYEDYVKKFVLNPCGMWHTRLVPPTAVTLQEAVGGAYGASSGNSEWDEGKDTQLTSVLRGEGKKKSKNISGGKGKGKKGKGKGKGKGKVVSILSGSQDQATDTVLSRARRAYDFGIKPRKEDIQIHIQPTPEVIPTLKKTTTSSSAKNNVGVDLTLMEQLDPLSVDSALGWTSTALDMARFARCVFDGDSVLDDASVETLLQQQFSAPTQRQDTWRCAGFKTNTRGEVWQDADPHGFDAILYHDLLGGREEYGRADLPDTWVVLLQGNHLHHLRHKTKELMKELAAEVGDTASHTGLVHDLSDIDATNVRDDALVKWRVDEHHLDGYVSALQREGYDVTWVSPYTHKRHTSFVVISRLAPHADFRLEHGLGEKQLPARKLHMERQGYNLTFLQSYRSQSHEDVYSFLALFRKDAFPSHTTQLKYGTGHLPEPYDRLVQMYHEQRFHPLVQSVLPHAGIKEERLTFIFLHTDHGPPVDFNNYYRLPADKLDTAILLNADKGLSLSFLDAYQLGAGGETLFSAAFTNASWPLWAWQAGLDKEQAEEFVESRLQAGLRPATIVAFSDSAGDLKFSVMLKTDQDTARPAPSSARGEDEPFVFAEHIAQDVPSGVYTDHTTGEEIGNLVQ